MEHDSARQQFFAETEELLNEMEQGLLLLEQGPDPEEIHRLFRAAHTIKGNSRIFPFPHMEAFAHQIEGLLEALRAGRAGISKPVVQLLLRARDHLASLAADAAEGQEPDEAALRRGMELAVELDAAGSAPTGQEEIPLSRDGFPVRWRVEWRIGPDAARDGLDPLAVLRRLGREGCIEAPHLRGELPRLAQFEPERCYLSLGFDYLTDLPLAGIRQSFESFLEHSSVNITQAEAGGGRDDLAVPAIPNAPAGRAPGGLPGEQRGAASKRRRSVSEPVIRVDATRLERLVDLVGELVIANAAANSQATRFGNRQLVETNAAVTRLVEGIRDSALTLRMVRLGETFGRFPPLVADMGRELGREVTLTISGGDTELDKTTADKIGDPLMHLVRNAIAHGIEPPEERVAEGKCAKGNVALRASTEAGSVIIQVTDDGRGFDTDRLLSKARTAGLIAAEDSPSQREIRQFAFEPGLSTAVHVSSYSGRGVGLDAVKRNVEALGGSVELESEERKGARISIRLPMTQSIIDGFRVGVAGLSYVLPLDTVVECLEMDSCAEGDDSHYVNLRGEVLPFLRLRELFCEPTSARELRENILVVSNGGQRVGLVVDELHGEYQTVVKPLGRLFRCAEGLSGATILGDGEVALILDVAHLVARASRVACTMRRLSA